MPRTVKRTEDRLVTIKVPESLVREIDRVLSEYEGHGYSSRLEFIRSAIRSHIEYIEKRYKRREGRLG